MDSEYEGDCECSCSDSDWESDDSETDTPVFDPYDFSCWPDILETTLERQHLDDLTLKHAEMFLALSNEEPATWNLLLKNGFWSSIMNAVTKNDFCGYSRDEFVCSKNAHTQLRMREYIAWLLLLFSRFFSIPEEQLDLDARQQLDELLELLQKRFPEIVSTLWEVRDPFLTSELSSKGLELLGDPSIHNCLIFFVRLTRIVLSRHRNHNITADNSRAAHLLLAVWINAGDIEAQVASILNLGEIVAYGRYQSIYSEIGANAELREHVYAALTRDLRDGRIVGSILRDVIGHSLCTCEPFDQPELPPREAASRLKVFWSVVAACRRQYCQQGHLGGWHDSIVMLTSNLITMPATDHPVDVFISEAQLYALVVLFAQAFNSLLDSAISGREERFSKLRERILIITSRLKKELSGHRDNLFADRYPEDRMMAMRCYAYQAWETSARNMYARRAVPTGEIWDLIVEIWRELGSYFPQRRHGGNNSSIFTPLERCSWAGCACSVFKPAHRLKVCKGCRLVAYCGSGCQTSAWSTHKAVCTKSGGGQTRA